MKTVKFKNKKGHTLSLNAKLTIADLVRMGMDRIRMTPKQKPPDYGEWSCTPSFPSSGYGIVKSVKGDEVEVEFTEHKIGGPKLSKNDPLSGTSIGWGSTTNTYRVDPSKPQVHPKGQEFHVVNFKGKKAPNIGWEKVKPAPNNSQTVFRNTQRLAWGRGGVKAA
jgi:hypothetical protein